MRRLFAILVFAGLAGTACHHDPAPATPADPSDKPPLPPASGTPIGFIIDDAGDLKLRDEQVAKLREIDTSLAAQLEVIDSQTRAANKPAEEAAAPAQSGGRRGGRHGGMGGGGMGGPSGGGSSGGHHRRGNGAGSGSGAPSNSAMVSKLVDERTADVKDALERAFALLDPAQQVGAKKVLIDHDVDVDINVGPPALPPPSQTGQMGEPGAPGGDADPPPEP